MGKGDVSLKITGEEVREIIRQGINETLYEGKKVLVLTPDATRTCPLPELIRAVNDTIGASCARLDFMIALGTHAPLIKDRILMLYGIEPRELSTRYYKSSFFNHRWDLPDTFTEIGIITDQEVFEISGGKLEEEVPILINRKLFEYDLVLIVGPVFPHEVVGFSGGAKYLFPGISGGDFLHFFHWLGALKTCQETIGIKNTPVRRLINRALDLITIPIRCLALVVDSDESLRGVYAGDICEAWSQAADLSAKVHIRYRDQTFQTVLGCSSQLYDEMWTASKVMHKLEQMVAKGGTLIIYGPQIKEISRTWGKQIMECGYHVRDYFLQQMDRYRHLPRGVLAHSTQVRGSGRFENGVEWPDVNVVLATSIPEEICQKVNLGYKNPFEIDLPTYQNREGDGTLFVANAGETLYKLKSGRTNSK